VLLGPADVQAWGAATSVAQRNRLDRVFDTARLDAIIRVPQRETIVPNTKTAKKQLLVSRRNRERNQHVLTTLKTALKKARAGIAEGKDATAAGAAVNLAVQVLHRTATKGVIKRQNASRRASRLMRAYNQCFAGAAGSDSAASEDA
jgi:small subunit ribosomal protein S20